MTSDYSELGATARRVHHEVLADGDADAAWENAAPAFREKHTKAELAELLKLYEKFRRGTLTPDSPPSRHVENGETYLIVTVSVLAWWADVERAIFVCQEDGDGKLRLVGIRSVRSGDLDKAIPDRLRPLASPHKSGWD